MSFSALFVLGWEVGTCIFACTRSDDIGAHTNMEAYSGTHTHRHIHKTLAHTYTHTHTGAHARYRRDGPQVTSPLLITSGYPHPHCPISLRKYIFLLKKLGKKRSFFFPRWRPIFRVSYGLHFFGTKMQSGGNFRRIVFCNPETIFGGQERIFGHDGWGTPIPKSSSGLPFRTKKMQSVGYPKNWPPAWKFFLTFFPPSC